MRRAFGVVLVVGAALLTGCGAGTDAPATPAPRGDVFPLTVEHSLGSTTIPAKPQRIVTIGTADVDVVLALGVKPVAVRSQYNFPRGVGPWAESALGDASPVVMPRTVNFETVAAARPDLILDVSGSGDQQQYDTLSKIAPTVGLPKGAPPYAARWDDTARLIARSLGMRAEGDALVDKTNAYLAGVKSANPSFAGKTLSYLDLYTTQVYVGGRSATTTATMDALGFTPTDYVKSLPQDKSQNEISLELLPQIDADVVIAYSIGATPEQAKQAIPQLKNLKAMQENRFHFLPDLSLSAPSVLSIPWGVDNLLPFLRQATAT